MGIGRQWKPICGNQCVCFHDLRTMPANHLLQRVDTVSSGFIPLNICVLGHTTIGRFNVARAVLLPLSSVCLWSNFAKKDFHHTANLIKSIFWSIWKSVSSCMSNKEFWLSSFGHWAVTHAPHILTLILLSREKGHDHAWITADVKSLLTTYLHFPWIMPRLSLFLQPFYWQNRRDLFQGAKSALLFPRILWIVHCWNIWSWLVNKQKSHLFCIFRILQTISSLWNHTATVTVARTLYQL